MIKIHNLTVYGDNVEKSVIDFSDGLNIIHGPSNTGKTVVLKCIDAALGASTWPLTGTGYTTIALTLLSNNQTIRLERKDGENRIHVTSNNTFDEYSLSRDTKSPSFNEYMMDLIGIDKNIKIIKNKACERQALTWRSIAHLFYLDRNRITSEKTMLMDANNSKIPTLTTLNYLYNGETFEKMVSKKKETETAATRKFIEKTIREKNKELMNLSIKGAQYNENIYEMLSKIDEYSKEITIMCSKRNELTDKITKNEKQLTEDTINYDSYHNLMNMYHTDLKRINFIADGIINEPKTCEIISCPICNSKVQYDSNNDILSSSFENYDRITTKIKGLTTTMESISIKIKQLEEMSKKLKKERNELDASLDDVKNKYNSTTIELKKYEDEKKKTERYKYTSQILEEFESKLEDYPIVKYEEFKIESNCDKTLFDDLTSCVSKADGFVFKSNSISIENCDIIRDGRKKSIEGAGYNGILNAMMVASVSDLLSKYEKHPTSFLMIDSPITDFEESENKTDITSGLFRYFIDISNKHQIIIAENRPIPKIDSMNVIEFSKNDTGRYGFLLSCRN